MNLPTREECTYLLKVAYRVPDNILQHSIEVNRVAVFLAIELKKKNIDVNIDLVDRASILHDIVKVIEIEEIFPIFNASGKNIIITISKKDRDRWEELKDKYEGKTHEEAAYMIFREKYPELALTIRKHGYNILSETNSLDTWEQKIVSYADKRVKHTEIIKLKDRFDDGHKRYKEKNIISKISPEMITEIDNKFFEIENEIFAHLDFKPEDLLLAIERSEGKITVKGD